MIKEYLLDSNILIYLSKGSVETRKGLEALKREYFFASTVTVAEVLAGEPDQKRLGELKDFLRQFVPIDFRREIAEAAALLYHKNKKKLKFKDLMIAATALEGGLTLVTADKDFKKIKGLKVKLVSP